MVLTAALFLLQAQAFQSLTTTDDGSVLYFSSPIRERDSNQTFHSKIFRWDASKGFQVVAEEPSEGQSDGCTTTKFFQLHDPQISADGSVLGYTATRPFAGSRYCDPQETNRAILPTLTLDGTLLLTKNGRFAVTSPLAAVANHFHYVTDLETRLSNAVAGAPSKTVTDAGTTLSLEPTALILTDRSGGTRVVQTKRSVSEAIIDRAGKTIVYIHPLGPDSSGYVSAIDVASGREIDLATGFALRGLSLTNDGLTVFYIDGPGILSVGIGGANERYVPGGPAYTVSGDGRVVYTVNSNRLLRVDVASRTFIELAPTTPFLPAIYRANGGPTQSAARGSQVELWIEAVQSVTICGRPVQFQAERARFQIPWDLPEGTCLVTVQTRSRFEHALPLEIVAYDPQYYSSVVHEGFFRPVTPIDPARTGEVVTVWMTGLGVLDSRGRLPSTFTCMVAGVPAELTYAGEVPGFAGYYQINLRMPAVSSGLGTLLCGFGPPWTATQVWTN